MLLNRKGNLCGLILGIQEDLLLSLLLSVDNKGRRIQMEAMGAVILNIRMFKVLGRSLLSLPPIIQNLPSPKPVFLCALKTGQLNFCFILINLERQSPVFQVKLFQGLRQPNLNETENDNEKR